MLYYFTNLIICNNIYENVSKRTTSGFHFETKSPISGSRVFYLHIQLNEKFQTPFLSLKNINEIILNQGNCKQMQQEPFYMYIVNF